MGRPFLPWQRYVADVSLEVDERGHFYYALVIVTVPRQSGKTTLFGAVMDQRALSTRYGHVWLTMQTAKDAVDWLTNEHWPMLGGFGNECSVRRMAGSEWVKWRRSGGTVRPFPPSPTGLHGKTSDLVAVDECWAFDLVRGQQLDQAIVPTQATKPNAQVWKCSTAGDASSLWWLGTTEVGQAAVKAGRTEGVAYFDWSCPEHLDPCAPESWPEFHPAYGHTIHAPAMLAALDMLGPDEFARAYGNRWTAQYARVIPLTAWLACLDEAAPLPEVHRVALGFDVALDRSDAAIVAAWRDNLGGAHLEVADYRPGTAWLPGRLEELRDKWQPVGIGHDAAGPALDVADALTRSGLTVSGLKGREYAAACSGLLELITGGKLKVRPHAALDLATSTAARRPLGDAWAWGRRQSASSIAPLTAATVAVWTWDHAPEALGDFRIA